MIFSLRRRPTRCTRMQRSSAKLHIQARGRFSCRECVLITRLGTHYNDFAPRNVLKSERPERWRIRRLSWSRDKRLVDGRIDRWATSSCGQGWSLLAMIVTLTPNWPYPVYPLNIIPGGFPLLRFFQGVQSLWLTFSLRLRNTSHSYFPIRIYYSGT